MATLWYPADWATIDTDELLFLAPSLSSARSPDSTEAGIVPYIEQRFAAQIQATALKLGASSTAGRAGGEVLDRIRASGAIDGFLARGSASRITGLDRASRTPKLTPLGAAERSIWLNELFVLACIDRLLRDAALGDSSAAPMPLAQAGLADALVASVHTQINAGYVYPRYAYAHELLMTGAWLGLLAAGRPAYMLPAIGDVLIAYLDRAAPEDAGQDDAGVADILGFYAALAGGRGRLLRVARKVSATGAPSLVTPARRPPGSGPAPVGAWNGALAARIAARLAEHEASTGSF